MLELGRLTQNKVADDNPASSATSIPAGANASPDNASNSPRAETLHKASPIMEQLSRLQKLSEFLMNGEKRNPEVALDLVDIIKNNLVPNSSNFATLSDLLDNLKALIHDRNFSEANTKITDIAKSLEENLKVANFKEQRNLEGGGFNTLIDTIVQHLLGNLAGPAMVQFVEKTLGIPINRVNLGSAKTHAKVAAGASGFQAAEFLIDGHMPGLPFKIEGWHGIDPILENISKKLINWVEMKNPRFKINFNNTVDKYVKQVLNSALGLVGKNKNGTRAYETELQNEIDNYIVNRNSIEIENPKARIEIVNKMLQADFKNKTGREIPGLVQHAMDYAFNTTDNNHFSKQSLLMNELALAVKPYLDKLGVAGKLIYNFLYHVVPNHFIFLFRPVGQYMLNDKERYFVNRANALKHTLEKPLESKKH